MVNYGYGPGTKLWDESKKYKLAEQLRQLLLDMKLTRNEEIDGQVIRHEYPEPYIEVDGLYPGVRLRKLTQLTEEQEDELLLKADQIYIKVMEAKE